MRSSLALLVTCLMACDGGTINQVTYDAPLPPIDASPPNYLGQACDAALNPCPSGWECLTQVGGNGSWCTRGCTGQSDPICNAGYVGPGWGSCLLVPEGRTTRVCTIVCRDEPGDPVVCPPGEDCTGTCPAPLACEAAIESNMILVGYSCS